MPGEAESAGTARERDFRRLAELLERLLDLPPDAEAAALAALADDDARLRPRLARALASARAEPASGPLSRPVAERLAALVALDGTSGTLPGGLAPGSELGAWSIEGELGRGGMGTVYAVRRADGQYEQRAALKLLRGAADDAASRERFRRERQILARLEHPSIARLLDGGVAPDGRPFLVLERVDGEPITAACDRRSLSVEQRLRRFVAVLEAVDAAHRSLVVHRDLKPSNILLTTSGEVKLLDFGVAKLLESGEGEELTRTRSPVPLTPQYAAPEQVTGEPVTTATDVYALGLVLYELLAGARPYRLTSGSALELERQIVEGVAAPPSVAASRAGEESAARRGLTARRLARRLEGDLDAIVLRALAREPERRYPSAAALARDLESHLAGRPVAARPDSRAYRARKFARRHRLGVAAGAALVLLLAAAVAALGYALVESRQKLAAAERARAIQGFLVGLFEEADPGQARGREVTARQLLDRGFERIERELAGQPAVQADLLTTLADLYKRLALFERGDAAIARALELRQRLGERTGPALALSVLTAGELRYEEDRYRDALPLLERAATLLAAAGGDHESELSRALSGQAAAHSALGEYAEAERLDREALRLDRGRFGAASLAVATDESNLALCLHKAERDAEALPLAEDALALRRRLLPADHPDVATSLQTLGLVEQALGRGGEAESALREAYALRQRVLGAEHPDTLDAGNSLRGLLDERGRRDEALALARALLEAGERVLAPDNPVLGIYASNLAVTAYRAGDWAAAECGFRAALASWRATYGEKHPAVASGHHNLGMALLELGRLDEATREIEAGLELRRELRGEDSPEFAQSLRGRGLVELARGDRESARADLDRAVELSRRVYPERHPRLAEALIARARLETAEGRRAEAVRDLEEALAIRVEKLGADNPLTAEARAALAQARRAAAPGARGD